ncbi:TadE/TadG family type IV pilus assembly protein [Paenibacillus azoreducens]|nr:TadE family protein [Paenibacillus azoreducens]
MRSNKRITHISSRLAWCRMIPSDQSGGRQQGSMVVEASLVLPMFIFFVLFLIYMVQMTLISTALQSTVSDTVKMVSTHIYPVALAIEQKAPETKSDGKEPAGSWSVPKLSLTDWAAQYTDTLPPPLNEWMAGAVDKVDEPLQDLKNQAAEAILDPVVKPILKPYMESRLLDYDRIHVSNIQIPNLRTRTDPYFGIVVSYELPMKVPFLDKKIVLQAKAQERLWIGETDEAGTGGEGESGQGNQVIELLEKPDPAYVGRRAKVRAKIAPGASANLSVFYKSGESTAKYLGEKQADSEGYIEWEWFVGTNTTPGTWPFVITTADGQRTEVMFTVVKG